MRWNPDGFIPDVIHEQAICRPPPREVGWEKSYAFVPHRCHHCRDAVWLETWWRYWVLGKMRWTVVKGLCTRCYVVGKLEKKPDANIDPGQYGLTTPDRLMLISQIQLRRNICVDSIRRDTGRIGCMNLGGQYKPIWGGQ